MVAIFADISQKGVQTSSVLKITESLKNGFGIIPVVTLIILIIMAIAVTIIFEADTYKKAFYYGASILSILMTFVPNKVNPLNTASLDASATTLAGHFVGIAHASELPQSQVKVTISIQTKNRTVPPNVVVTVYDAASGEVKGSSTYKGSEFSFYQQPGNYSIMIEAEGYQTERYSLVLNPNQTERIIPVMLSPTWQSPAIQRLYRK